MEQITNSVNLYGDFRPEQFHPGVLQMYGVEKIEPTDVSVSNISEFGTNFSVGRTNYFMDKFRFQISSPERISKIINRKLKKLFVPQLAEFSFSGHNFMSYIHSELDGIEQWKNINKRFAPLSPWGKFGRQMRTANPAELCGLSSLKMSASEELESFTIIKLATIERSMMFQNTAGIFIGVDFFYKYKLNQTAIKFIEYAKAMEDQFTTESSSIIETIKEAC